MSEASRQRWLFVHNRLEELAARYGPPPEVGEPEAIECDPSWGPVGSLAERLLGPGEYARLREMDVEMARMERSARRARGEQLPAEPPPPGADW
jgi:hypothetical protein